MRNRQTSLDDSFYKKLIIRCEQKIRCRIAWVLETLGDLLTGLIVRNRSTEYTVVGVTRVAIVDPVPSGHPYYFVMALILGPWFFFGVSRVS